MEARVRKRIWLAVCFAILALGTARAADDVIVVFDASNSMWGQIDGVAKIEIAREVMGDLILNWDPATNLGLVVYGHRTTDDCSDIETVIPPGPLNAEAYMAEINAITPRGRTPLTDAVQHAAEELAYRESAGTVILISDGIESCDRDPCAVSTLLAQNGIAFTAHVIGFGLTADQDPETLACIADATGGLFLTAQNAGELTDALAEIATQVAQAPEPEPAPPEPEPEPELQAVEITAPAQAIVGSRFAVSWTPTLGDTDFVTIVPVGADDGILGNYVRTNTEQPAELRAPADPGFYEVRYVVDEGRETAGLATIEIVDAEVAITAPETATVGTTFEVAWSQTIDDADFITIVPAGTDDGILGNYIRANSDNPGDLQAPAEPGLYEIRYVLDEGRRTIGVTGIELVEAEVTLTVPETATAGTTFEVAWSTVVDESDFITIVPVGADEGTLGNYIRANSDNPGDLQAPAEPGLYEVRYVLDEGRQTLAAVPIEIVGAEVTLTAPATATAGATFEVAWSNIVDPSDFITILPVGTDGGTLGNYVRANADQPADLQAPAEPGFYEVRYVLDEGRVTLATAMIELVEAEVTLTAPPAATVGTAFEVAWSQTIDDADFITIVPVGADEGALGNYVRANADQPADLQAPAEPGFYEVRYVLDEGRVTLATAMIELVEAEVTIEAATAIVRAGGEVRVTWTGTVSTRDFIAIVPLGAAEGTLAGYYLAANDAGAATLIAPDEPGFYEVRYILNEGRRTLASATIEVVPADAQINQGATLEVPAIVAPGAAFSVSWTAEVTGGDQRITLASPDQPDFTWIAMQSAAAGPPLEFTAPSAPGFYEIRFLDIASQTVLSRATIEVR